MARVRTRKTWRSINPVNPTGGLRGSLATRAFARRRASARKRDESDQGRGPLPRLASQDNTRGKLSQEENNQTVSRRQGWEAEGKPSRVSELHELRHTPRSLRNLSALRVSILSRLEPAAKIPHRVHRGSQRTQRNADETDASTSSAPLRWRVSVLQPSLFSFGKSVAADHALQSRELCLD